MATNNLLKNTGTGFLDKYKNTYGTDYDSNVGVQKKDGISDMQHESMSDLEKYYGMEKNRTNQHDNNMSLLEDMYGDNGSLTKKLNAQKAQSQRTASTSLTQLEKYLPAQAQASGYGGFGASQSALLDAHNIYNNSMGNINATHNSSLGNIQSQYLNGKSELENAYGSDITNIKSDSMDRTTAILEKYAAIDREQKNIERERQYAAEIKQKDIEREQENIEKERKYAAEVERFNYFKEMIGEKGGLYLGQDGKMSQDDYNRLESYAKNNLGGLNEHDQKTLDYILNSNKDYIRTDSEISAINEEKALNTVKPSTIKLNDGLRGDKGANDNFSVKTEDGGSIYQIESGGKVTDDDITNQALLLEDRTVFGYKNKLYIKAKNGVFLIQGRPRTGAYASHYQDLFNSVYGKK